MLIGEWIEACQSPFRQVSHVREHEAVDIVRIRHAVRDDLRGRDVERADPVEASADLREQPDELRRQVRRGSELHLDVVAELQREVAGGRVDADRLGQGSDLARQGDRQLSCRRERSAGELTLLDIGICPRDQHVVDGNAVDHVEHAAITIDDPVLAVGAGKGGDRLALADVDEHPVRELRGDPSRLDPGDALELALDLAGVDQQDRVAVQIVDDRRQLLRIGVDRALHVDRAHVEQRRRQHGDGTDQHQEDRRGDRHPDQPLAPLGTAHGDAPGAHPGIHRSRTSGPAAPRCCRASSRSLMTIVDRPAELSSSAGVHFAQPRAGFLVEVEGVGTIVVADHDQLARRIGAAVLGDGAVESPAAGVDLLGLSTPVRRSRRVRCRRSVPASVPVGCRATGLVRDPASDRSPGRRSRSPRPPCRRTPPAAPRERRRGLRRCGLGCCVFGFGSSAMGRDPRSEPRRPR